jgi:hypothetical protein
MEAVKIRLLFVDNNRSTIVVNISVVIALVNDDGSVAIPIITVADDVTITVPVTISATLANRYANGPTPTPTTSAPAGIAQLIPATAAIRIERVARREPIAAPPQVVEAKGGCPAHCSPGPSS